MNDQLASTARPEYSPGYLYRSQLQTTREGGQCKPLPTQRTQTRFPD